MQFMLYYKSKRRKYIGIAVVLHFCLSAGQANWTPNGCLEKFDFESNRITSSILFSSYLCKDFSFHCAMKTQSWLHFVDFLWNDLREIFLEWMMLNYLIQASEQE